MRLKNMFSALGRAVDPKRDFNKEIPRPLLLTKYAIEYIYKVSGYFILLCLIVGLSFSACSDNLFLLILPFFFGGLLMLYVTITTIGIPLFLLIAEIEHLLFRRTFSYLAIFGIFSFSLYLLEEAPVFDVLTSYLHRFFPSAFKCMEGIAKLG